jgi:hypothetical protein
MPYSGTIDPVLIEKAAQWRTMHIIRVMLFMAVNRAFLPVIHRMARMLCTAELEAR